MNKGVINPEWRLGGRGWRGGWGVGWGYESMEPSFLVQLRVPDVHLNKSCIKATASICMAKVPRLLHVGLKDVFDR